MDELHAAALEAEIRSGAPGTVIVDVREPSEFAAWRIDPGRVPLVNLPLERVAADPRAAAEALRSRGSRVRVICARGSRSADAAARLRGAEVPASSVIGGMAAWSRVLAHQDVPVGTSARVVQFRREARGCLSYLVAGAAGEALVVDPAPDPSPYIEVARERGWRVTQVLDTHIHADHVSGARPLQDATGAALRVSRAALARGIEDPRRFTPVDDGERLEIAGVDAHVLALPGHTSDNVGVLIDGRALVAGDSIFADAVARPDLEAGSDGAGAAARALYRTIGNRIMTLPDETILLPCHYGGGRLDRPVAPTIGSIRSALDLLRLDEDAFVERVLADMPERPANYLAIIAANLRGPGEDAADLEVGANNCAAGAHAQAP